MFSVENRSKAITVGVCTAIVGYGLHKLYNYLITHVTESPACNVFRNSQRRVLVLGLSGSGKTRLVQCFLCSLGPIHDVDVIPQPMPTIGFETRSVSMDGVDFLFWDGNEQDSEQCQEMMVNADVLLWVVDSTRADLIPRSRDFLHELLHQSDIRVQKGVGKRSSRNYYGIPVVVVATKQDVSLCLCLTDVSRKMEIDELRKKHKVYVVATGLPNLGRHKGLLQLFEKMAFSKNKRYNCHEG